MNTRSQTTTADRSPARGPARPDGGVQPLRLPSIDQRLRYALRYWCTRLRSLMSEHRLHTGCVGRYAAPVALSGPLLRRWQALFGTEDGSTPVPFTYGRSVGALLHARVFADLGFNLRHLLHLQHHTQHVASPAECAGAHHHELVCGLQGAWCLNGGKALIALRTEIRRPADEGGSLLALHEDRFLIRGLPATDLAVLGCDLKTLQELQDLRERVPQIDPATPGARVLALPLAADFGRRYGRISGDLGPAHAGGLPARLFGVRQPFAQGLGLRNIVARELTALGLPLAELKINFVAPAHLGQTLQLLVLDQRFELVDEAARMVACGQASSPPT